MQKSFNEALFKYMPHLKDKIDYYSVGTALTVENYIDAKDGNTYGYVQ